MPRSPSWLTLTAATLSTLGALLLSPALAPAERLSVYSNSNLIVYNTNVPESLELAKFYAAQRKIPDSNFFALDCPTTEEITRSEFEQTIAKPLRDAFTDNNWWKIYLNPEEARMQVVSNRFHVITLMYGMPVKVRDDVPPVTQTDPDTGEETTLPKSPLETTGCSVDSELAMLGSFDPPKPGAITNPYFNKNVPFFQARLPSMILVGRIDGPSLDVAKRMITDAIEAEEKGLWGIAYFDLSQKYPKGDEWILNSMNAYAGEGIPVVLDRYVARFGTNFPMRDASVYFGWYTRNVDGPFLNPKFRFRPGAVASHLHSFSANTLRTTEYDWVGPLLDKGAAAVLGNVYEPYLDLTHHYDVFNTRLLQGYTFIESNYMSLPAISWMNIAVGDPLYRPFEAFQEFTERNYSKDENTAFKAYRLAVKRWGRSEPEVLHDRLADAVKKLESPLILEAMGLNAARNGDPDTALGLFDLAAAHYPDPEDQIRIGLHQVQVHRDSGNIDAATALLTELAKTHDTLPETESVRILLTTQKTPPPPPTDTPPPPPPPTESWRRTHCHHNTSP
ncbi:MAG: TIGR03790 family protein, partial [Verrucomicrobiota bacterium]